MKVLGRSNFRHKRETVGRLSNGEERDESYIVSMIRTCFVSLVRKTNEQVVADILYHHHPISSLHRRPDIDTVSAKFAASWESVGVQFT